MTIKEAKKLLNCSKQSWYYYKKTGQIHVKDYQVNDDEVWAILDSKTKKQISDNAKKRIENDFSLRTIVDKTIDYYNRVINKFKNENTIC